MKWDQAIPAASRRQQAEKSNKAHDVFVTLLFVMALLLSSLDFNSLLG